MGYDPSLVDLATAQAIYNSEQNRLREYTEALSAYNGQLPEPLTIEPGEINDNITVNIIAPIVEANVAYLFGQPFDFDLPGGEIAADDTPEESWLKACLQANNYPLFLNEFAINGSLAGTAFYKIDTTSPLPNYRKDLTGPPTFPRLQVLDPACTEVFTDDMNIDRVTMYKYERCTTDKQGRTMYKQQLCVLNEDEQSWTIIDRHAYGSGTGSLYSAKNWITDKETVWPYAWPPYGHCKNLPQPNDVYGKPDITRTLIKANKALNFNMSNRNRIDKLHSHPIVYIIGYNGDVKKLDMGPGSLLNIPGGWMGNNPEIGQIVPSIDSSSPRSTADDTYEFALEEAQTPAPVLGRMGAKEINDPSGLALRYRLAPLLKKTEVKEGVTYGPCIVEQMRRIMELAEFGPDQYASLHWAELVPNDPLLERQAMEADLRMGLASVETISEKMGYDWEKEKEKIVLERKAGIYPNLQPGQNQQQGTGPRDSQQAGNMASHAQQMSGSNNGMRKPNDN